MYLILMICLNQTVAWSVVMSSWISSSIEMIECFAECTHALRAKKKSNNFIFRGNISVCALDVCLHYASTCPAMRADEINRSEGHLKAVSCPRGGSFARVSIFPLHVKCVFVQQKQYDWIEIGRVQFHTSLRARSDILPGGRSFEERVHFRNNFRTDADSGKRDDSRKPHDHRIVWFCQVVLENQHFSSFKPMSNIYI